MNVVQTLAEELGWRFLAKGAVSSASVGADVMVVLAPQWSSKDLGILRRVAVRIPESILVEITDIDFLAEPRYYGGVVPEAPIVTQTPVLAHYAAGHLVRIWQGPDQVEAYPT